MTILWCGGEDIDFTGNALQNSTTTYCKVGNLSRASMYGSGFSKSSNLFNAITSGWLSFQGYFSTDIATKNMFICGLIQSSTTNKGIWVGVDASTAGKLAIYKYDGSVKTNLISEAGVSISNQIHKIDINIINYGVNGTINVYLNSLLLMTYTGDITIQDVTGFDAVGVGGGCATVGLLNVSEIIVADTDTSFLLLIPIIPSSTGSISEWTGTYADIDDIAALNTDFLITYYADKTFKCNTTNLTSGPYSIKALKLISSASMQDSSLNLQMGIQCEETTYLSTAVQLTSTISSQSILYNTNPITNLPFTKLDILNLQFVYKSIAA